MKILSSESADWRTNAHCVLLLALLCAMLPMASCSKKEAGATGQATGGRIKWQYKSNGMGMSHPAIGADGTIYAGTNLGLLALSPEGKLLWEAPLNTPETPVVSEDGTIYMNLRPGLLFGVSKEGKYIWRPGYGLIGFAAPPALSTNTTLFPMNKVGDIYMFQPKRSEEKVWSLDTCREGMLGTSTVLAGSARVDAITTRAAPVLTRNGSLSLKLQDYILATPVLAEDGTIFVMSGRNLSTISPEGKALTKTEIGSGAESSPTLAPDGTVYVATYDMKVIAYAGWTWSANEFAVAEVSGRPGQYGERPFVLIRRALELSN